MLLTYDVIDLLGTETLCQRGIHEPIVPPKHNTYNYNTRMITKKVIFLLHYLLFFPLMLLTGTAWLVCFIYSNLQVLGIERIDNMLGYTWLIPLWLITPFFLASTSLFFLSNAALSRGQKIAKIVVATMIIFLILMLQVILAELFF